MTVNIFKTKMNNYVTVKATCDASHQPTKKINETVQKTAFKLTTPFVPSLTGLKDGCPCGFIAKGLTDRLLPIAPLPGGPPGPPEGPPPSCQYDIWTFAIETS
jgi:hypothetical protein